MTKYEIVEDLANSSTVEKMVYKILSSSKNIFDCPQDLIQDIYLLILEKDDTQVQDLYDKGELNYFLLTVTRNQMLSKNSPYYYKYIKFGKQSENLEEHKDIPLED